MRPTATARRATRRADVSGFSLIELMIVVAIIGILAGIAYPSYGEYVKRTRRSDAHLALLSAVQALERCKSTSFSYVGCNLPNGGTSPEGYYTLTMPAPTASAFSITATPVAGKAQAGDTDCATITLNHLGTQGPVPGCWN